MDTSRQTKNLNKLLIRILLHLQVEFSFQEMFVSREMILFFPFFLLRSFIGEVAGVSFAVKKMIYIILHENDMPFIDFVICDRIGSLL